MAGTRVVGDISVRTAKYGEECSNRLLSAPARSRLAKIAEPGGNLLLNCGYGHGLSVLEVLDAVDRANGAPLERRMEGRRPGDPPALVAGNERLLATLDWRPRHDDIDAIVTSALAWERKLAEHAG